jgi:outer membrane protein OmpA-like peptidoglycan-associated protein/tetratricopeptide (TPR) repeat protein
MKRVYSLFLFLFLSVSLALGQNVAFEASAFAGKEDGLKVALKNIKNGDKQFKSSPPNYHKALEYYLKANNFNPNNAALNYKIGACYFHTRKYEKATVHLEKAKNLDEKAGFDLKFLLAKCYHLDYKLDEAIELLVQFRQTLDPQTITQYEKAIEKEINECKTAKELIKDPIRVVIDNMGKGINSKYPEYSPVVTADRSIVFFTSRRQTTTGGQIDESINQYFEDIYFTQKDSTGAWGSAINPGKPLNSENHDAVVGISPDGQQIYIFKGEDNGDIYTSRLDGEIWTKPESLGKNINSPYHEASASFSFDFLTVYFVSNRPDGYGGHDIYKSRKDEKGRWGPAENLGGDINTPFEEAAIFAHPDGKTFYFSSKGHNTMGGFDIFKITYKDGKWSAPQNMGYPLNTTGDDVFFSISADGKYGYYSSSKSGGEGGHDIYQITFLGKEKPLVTNTEDNLLAFRTTGVQEKVIEEKVDIQEVNMMILKGTITDEYTKEPLFATIELTDLSTNKVVATFENNKASGKYLLSLPAGKNYGITVNSDECLFYSDNIDLRESDGFNELVKDIQLKKISVGSSVVLKNIFFDSGKSTLKKESEAELATLLKMMNDVPTLKIEISGHTDNVGSATFNKKLSERRAKAVVDYLIGKGISNDRMTFVGYGFEKPKASNDTPEGRQENRRTEFKVLSR